MTHTPGPWSVEAGLLGEGAHIFAADPKGCKADGDLVTVADLIENKANARLIAAAPDLLAALKGLGISANRDVPADGLCFMDCYLKGHGHFEECATARAAIAKAEGVVPVTTTPDEPQP